MTKLPTGSKERKAIPIYTGFLSYFPDAIAAVAECSRIGNEQHNPNTKLHWDRAKSGDERDALSRHLLESGTFDEDGIRHSTKVAWRALAALQKELEESAKLSSSYVSDYCSEPTEAESPYISGYVSVPVGDWKIAPSINQETSAAWDAAYRSNVSRVSK